jgi:aryl-alcohol dehydrogenase-like predicted oxidoreductase
MKKPEETMKKPEEKMKKKQESQSSSPISRRAFVATTSAAMAAGALSSPESAHGGLSTGSSASGAAPAIPWRDFGKTGIQVPIAGLGAGSRFYRPIPSDEDAAELVRQTIDRGLEFVETSANYGPDGISEKRIGLAMKTHRDKVFLETKVDERDYDGAMREMERSMERMNTDRLDLVLHHILRDEAVVDEVASANGAEKAIRQMIDEGVVRFRGFSTHLPATAVYAIEKLEPHAIQMPINAVRVPDFEPEAIPAANERGVAVIAMKTCGNGFFFPANATTPDRIEEYGPPEGVWDRWDLPNWTDYLHYVWSLPISAAVIGIDSFFTLDGIVSAASSFEPLNAERMASIHERAQVFETTGYWIPRG